MPPKTRPKQNKSLEEVLWDSATALRSSMDAAEYKHPVLGLIFLKYVSDTFTAQLHHGGSRGAGRGASWLELVRLPCSEPSAPKTRAVARYRPDWAMSVVRLHVIPCMCRRGCWPLARGWAVAWW
ncbi:type I restriction-modification system subunit M N-terminal domain-containing protein [Lentzea albida]|uniref:type I restriction-modification system subunit M N-terminal domain-containing protein n=1 Tax=Lentzea albida TaxID=65499 RepID=UPI001160B947|nr:type I restriction-modification system subunit M N-terminal domain-containing protein [Lentzea albida]